MKRIISLLLVLVSLFSVALADDYYRINDIDYNEVNKNCRTTVILAEQEEKIKPYNVFIGIQWGDSIETVRDMFGKGKENKLDIMTFITYENVKFGDLEPYNIRFGFANERLFSITVLFMLPKDDFYQNMVNAYTQELGQETQKEEYKYIWEMPDGTRIEVETDKHNNSVDLSFTNSEWVEEESTEYNE